MDSILLLQKISYLSQAAYSNKENYFKRKKIILKKKRRYWELRIQSG